jgi:predicted nucleic acid-binding protein
MVLAQELKAIIMADEWAVIKEARKRNLRVTSTLIILVEAKRQNLINSVRQELDELISAGFRTTPELVQEVLKRAGE